jgi:hypothetical protein
MHNTMKAYGEVEVYLHYSWIPQYMDVDDQLHFSVALLPR